MSAEPLFNFGKYKGRSIKDICIIDPNYVKWAINKGLIRLPKYLKL